MWCLAHLIMGSPCFSGCLCVLCTSFVDIWSWDFVLVFCYFIFVRYALLISYVFYRKDKRKPSTCFDFMWSIFRLIIYYFCFLCPCMLCCLIIAVWYICWPFYVSGLCSSLHGCYFLYLYIGLYMYNLFIAYLFNYLFIIYLFIVWFILR